MPKEKPLTQGEFLLQKFPGKGGWTYAELPEIHPNKNNPFSWVIVKGNIDSYQLKQYKLMPMGNGKLFLPVKAAVRKLIKKEAGDYVAITLYPDTMVITITEELKACFTTEPKVVFQNFNQLKPEEQKNYIDWIDAAKTDTTKAKRIAAMMARLEKGLTIKDPFP